MQDINIDTNEKKKEEKFNLNEDIKAKKGLTLVMNMIIQLFLLSSAIYLIASTQVHLFHHPGLIA